MKASLPPRAPKGPQEIMKAYNDLREFIIGRQVINVVGAVKDIQILTTPSGRLIGIGEITGITGGGGTGPGGCCVALACTVLSEVDCLNAGGFYFGEGVDCMPVLCNGGSLEFGACCHGTSCTYTSYYACISSGGVFQGVGSTCSPNPCLIAPGMGACCADDGSCTDTTSGTCGGTWNGGTNCHSISCPVVDPTGACCQTPLSSCVVTTESACTGLFHEGIDCSSVGSCEHDFCGPTNYYCDPGNPHNCFPDRPPYWGPHTACCPYDFETCAQCYDSISEICYACCCHISQWGWYCL